MSKMQFFIKLVKKPVKAGDIAQYIVGAYGSFNDIKVITFLFNYMDSQLIFNSISSLGFCDITVDSNYYGKGTLVVKLVPKTPIDYVYCKGIKLLDLDFTVSAGEGKRVRLVLLPVSICMNNGTEEVGKAASCDFITNSKPILIGDGSTLNILLPDATCGGFYLEQLKASGGVAPLMFSCNGLPEGMSLSDSGQLSGWTLEPGEFMFELVVTDSGENVQQDGLVVGYKVVNGSFAVPEWKSYTIMAGVYQEFKIPVSGSGPFRWQLQSGSLPRGISLASNGLLSGVSLSTGRYKSSIKVTDSGGTSGIITLDITSKAFSPGETQGRWPSITDIVTLPNAEKQPFKLEISLITGTTDRSLYILEIGGVQVWHGALPEKQTTIYTSCAPCGAQILKLYLDSEAPPHHTAVIEKIKVIAGEEHKRCGAKPEIIEFQKVNSIGTVLSPGFEINLSKPLEVPLVMPGSADDMVVSRKDGLEIFSSDIKGQISAIRMVETSVLVKLQPLYTAVVGKQLLAAVASDKRTLFVAKLIHGEWKGSFQQRFPGTKIQHLSSGCFGVDNKEKLLILFNNQYFSSINPETIVDEFGAVLKGSAGIEEFPAIKLKEAGSILAIKRYEGSMSELNLDSSGTITQKTVCTDLKQPVSLIICEPLSDGSQIAAVGNRLTGEINYLKQQNGVWQSLYVQQVGVGPELLIPVSLTLLTSGSSSQGSSPLDMMQQVITGDIKSSTISIIDVGGLGCIEPDTYNGPEGLIAVALARDCTGRLLMVAASSTTGEIKTYHSYAYYGSCQVTAIATEVLKNHQSWYRRNAFVVGNGGLEILTIESIKLTGYQSRYFKIINCPSTELTLVQGKAVSFGLYFLGGTSGLYVCNIEIKSNDPLYPVIVVPVRIEQV